MKLHKYTQEEKEFLREFVPEHSYKEIQQAFIDKFKWNISLGQIISSIKRYHLNTGRTGRFEKGHISWNKGKKGVFYSGSEKGWFEKGSIPPNLRQMGAERINVDGYIEIKTEETKTSYRWKLKHRMIWEQENGKIPQGYVVMFKDGDKLNTDIDNLMLVSRKVLAVMNKRGLYKSGYRETAALMAELKIKANEKRRGVRNEE